MLTIQWFGRLVEIVKKVYLKVNNNQWLNQIIVYH